MNRSPEQAAHFDPREPACTTEEPTLGVRIWLSERADTRFARLALLWFRRYFEASRNSGAAASAYVTLSVLPAALVIIAFFNLASGDENAFADRLITHMNLDGSTASLVRDLFGTTSNNLLAASITIVIGFLVWGLSIGQLYQDVYARAWRIQVGTAADQLRFAIWFFVFSGSIALDDRLGVGAPSRTAGWCCFRPGSPARCFSGSGPRASCSIARSRFARSCPGRCWRPSSSAGRSPPRRSGSGPTLNQNAKAFGSFGVVLGLFAYILIVVTISMVCAVFAPVWAEWRQGEKDRKRQRPSAAG